MTGPTEAELYSKDLPFPARVTENRLLSKPGSAKETRHFVVDISGSGLHYKAGDSLGVFPKNRPGDVDDILRCLDLSGEERVLPPALRLSEPLDLRTALTERLTLAKPTRKFVEGLALRAANPGEKARLEGLLAPESADLLSGMLEQREYVDLLAEYPSVRLSAQELVEYLRKLMPRLYSVASSPRISPTEIHLTVAIVRYETNNRERAGVCSTFLSDRVQVGITPVPVFVSHAHFGPPEDTSRDCIMVGPGTGIAPFRAFLQDRTSAGAKGRNWLFFGDQKRATDFLYEEEWAQYQAQGGLTRFDTAFSRDQPVKIYVQDRMREHAAELWRWIDAGAAFYVCGDAKRMARDVDVTLHDIIAEQGGKTVEQAADYVRQMKKDRRYQRDVY